MTKAKTKVQLGVILHHAEEGGYWLEVPSLPGCVSQGETIEGALKNIKEAIELFLETGEAVPVEKEEGVTVTVEVSVPA